MQSISLTPFARTRTVWTIAMLRRLVAAGRVWCTDSMSGAYKLTPEATVARTSRRSVTINAFKVVNVSSLFVEV